MISKIILGTAQFGLNYGINNSEGKPSIESVFSILDFAQKRGIKVLDTADAYGDAKEILGQYLKKSASFFEVNSKFKNSELLLEKKTDYSLKDLNIRNFNTYFFHDFSDFKQYEELMPSLLALKAKGVIKKIGLSVYSNEEFYNAILNDHIDVIQLPFNLLDNYYQRGCLLKKEKQQGK